MLVDSAELAAEARSLVPKPHAADTSPPTMPTAPSVLGSTHRVGDAHPKPVALATGTQTRETSVDKAGTRSVRMESGQRYIVKGLSADLSPKRLLDHFPTAERVEVVLNTRTRARVCTSIVFGAGAVVGSPRSAALGVTLQRVIHGIRPDTDCEIQRWSRTHSSGTMA